MKPYYQDDSVTLYHGDCLEVMPELGRFDLLLTDPPYGINQDRGVGSGGFSKITKQKRLANKYEGSWDKSICAKEVLAATTLAERSIVWGGNYYSGVLPQMPKWLVWNKCQTMPSFSDAELAWTSLSGVAVKMFTFNGNGFMAKEMNRQHPTQKPLALMSWCIGLAPDAKTILDPFAGSGTTGRAAKDLGRKCVMIEKDERYCEIAANRMKQEVLGI